MDYGGGVWRQEYKGDKLGGTWKGPQLSLPTQGTRRTEWQEDLSLAQLMPESIRFSMGWVLGRKEIVDGSKMRFPGLIPKIF